MSYPLHTEFWGGMFGSLVDKFGINWMFNYEHPEFRVPMGRQEVIVTHTFKAPRDKVYKAYTDPAQVAQWWGPREYKNKVEIMNVRPGGEWRIVQRDASGHEEAFRGVYHDVKPNERIIRTFEYEPMPGHTILEVVTFEDYDGGTRVTERSIYTDIEDRDGMVQMGMEKGVKESAERFSELMQKTKQQVQKA